MSLMTSKPSGMGFRAFSDYQISPLSLAIVNNRADEAIQLIEEGYFIPSDRQNFGILNQAIYDCPNKKLLELIITKLDKNEINRIDTNNISSLMLASIHRNLELINRLVHAGADVNLLNKFQQTALHFVLECDNPNDKSLVAHNTDIQTVQCLIGHGALVDTLDWNGITPLCHYIKRLDQIKIDPNLIALLVAEGSSIPSLEEIKKWASENESTICTAIEKGIQLRRNVVTNALNPSFTFSPLMNCITQYV